VRAPLEDPALEIAAFTDRAPVKAAEDFTSSALSLVISRIHTFSLQLYILDHTKSPLRRIKRYVSSVLPLTKRPYFASE
jgi:hypothetical protein